MAAPLPSSKSSVDLSAGPRVSRIRRDPPPKVKEAPPRDPADVDRMHVVVGVIVFTLSLLVIAGAIAIWGGWSPSQYELRFEE